MSLDLYLYDGDTMVYEGNITHNLGRMAAEAGLYGVLWEPEKNGVQRASDMLLLLEMGLDRLEAMPDRLREMNPSNGWGSYEGLVRFVREVRQAVLEYPDATVFASR